MVIRKKLKNIANKHPKMFSFYCKLNNHLLSKNHIKGRDLEYEKALLKNCRIRIKGKNNKVLIDDYTIMKDSKISIIGNDNLIHIKNNCRIYNGNFGIENDNNIIEIGQGTTIFGLTHLDCIEGTKLIVGKDCMFSFDVSIRTGDSHSIINYDKKRINQSKDIIIGNHVWLGTKVIILQGSYIPNNCIVGAGSLVTSVFTQNNIVIAGNPAKSIKQQINWLRERI